MTKLTGKNTPWNWSSQCQDAFTGLKADLTDSPVLASPDITKHFEVVTDACGEGIGAVLMQEGQPVAYLSRKLQGAELNYTTTEQELLASITAMRTWRCLLEGLPREQVTLVTDHYPNTYLPTQPEMSRRQARWSEFLQRFNFRWEYRPGRRNVADPVSRMPHSAASVAGAIQVPDQHLGAITSGSCAQVSDCHSWLKQCLAGSRTLGVGAVDLYTNDPLIVKSQHRYTQKAGLFFHEGRLVLPDHANIRQKVFESLHSTLFAGHKGRHATIKLVKREYYWPNMDADIAEWIRVCPPCQRDKGSNRLPAGELQPLPVPEQRWSDVSMDFITHLPRTRSGHTSIYVVVDRLSKLAHFIPTVDTATAEDVARLFIGNIFVQHGMPRRIVSDRDTRFTGSFWASMCEIWGCERQMSTAYHPQTDGQTERVNRTLEDMLRHWCSPDQDDWDQYLKLAEFAYNNAYHESIGDTPFMLTFGQHPYTPASLFRTDVHGKLPNPSARSFQAGMQERVQKAKQSLEGAQCRQKAYADQRRRALDLDIGSYVKLSTVNLAEKGHIWSLGEGIHLKMPHGNQNATLKTVLLPCRNTGTSRSLDDQGTWANHLLRSSYRGLLVHIFLNILSVP